MFSFNERINKGYGIWDFWRNERVCKMLGQGLIVKNHDRDDI